MRTYTITFNNGNPPLKVHASQMDCDVDFPFVQFTHEDRLAAMVRWAEVSHVTVEEARYV